MSDPDETTKITTILEEAVSSVFAEVAFIDVEKPRSVEAQEADLETAGKTDLLCAAIDVLSPLSYRLEIRVGKKLLDKIVENLFPEGDLESRKKNAEDSLLEMLNIIAGNFISAFFGAGSETQLELPGYLYFSEKEGGTPVCGLSLDAEGEPVEVFLYSVRYRY